MRRVEGMEVTESLTGMKISVATKTMSISRKSTEEFSTNIAPVVFAVELGDGTVCLVQKDGQVRVFEVRERELEVCPCPHHSPFITCCYLALNAGPA